jgi:uncharacterized protein with ParB-like and HNH nuclease domain
VLKDISIPPYSIIRKITVSLDEKKQICEKKIYEIIDGKQRLNALISFCKGEYAIQWEKNDYYFKDLDEKAQWTIKTHNIYGNEADDTYIDPSVLQQMNIKDFKNWHIKDEDKIKWFNLLNFAGTTQDVEHMNNLNNAIQK